MKIGYICFLHNEMGRSAAYTEYAEGYIRGKISIKLFVSYLCHSLDGEGIYMHIIPIYLFNIYIRIKNIKIRNF